MSKVAVVGTGAWGTALALQAHRAGNDVTLVARAPETAAAIARTRESQRLPGIRLPAEIGVATTVPPDAALILWVVPTQHLRESLIAHPSGGTPILLCCKGVEASTHLLPLEILESVRPGTRAGVLTGPNFAHEIAHGAPAAAVVASTDAALREQALATLGGGAFRLYGNDDPIGAQLGGAAKNVIAIAAGAVIGAGLGENARAALVTRGLAEISRLAVALGGRFETVMGLSGLGDLLLTCTGPSSRNFSLGFALGQGKPLAEILAARTAVTEGVPTAAALIARAGDVELPICQAVADLVSGRIDLKQAIARLLSRPQKDE